MKLGGWEAGKLGSNGIRNWECGRLKLEGGEAMKLGGREAGKWGSYEAGKRDISAKVFLCRGSLKGTEKKQK
jgi:hypothetical protein